MDLTCLLSGIAAGFATARLNGLCMLIEDQPYGETSNELHKFLGLDNGGNNEGFACMQFRLIHVKNLHSPLPLNLKSLSGCIVISPADEAPFLALKVGVRLEKWVVVARLPGPTVEHLHQAMHQHQGGGHPALFKNVWETTTWVRFPRGGTTMKTSDLGSVKDSNCAVTMMWTSRLSAITMWKGVLKTAGSTSLC